MDTTHEQRKALREFDWSSDLNVRDEFKKMSEEEIRAELLPRRNGFHFVFENALRDFNFGGIIRASNGFCCNGITYTGFRRYDPRGTVGTRKYEDITHLPDPKDFTRFIRARQNVGIPFIVAEYLTEESEFYDKQVSLPYFQWPDECTVMFGEEGTGVSDEYLYHADVIVYVPQFGSVRSLNVASTAHIFMYDYMVKTGRM
jgi:tRNA G18 (ribose-2'-O)-methylase SpoU